jgi:tetratricopeptide (TPR) repeat protein
MMKQELEGLFMRQGLRTAVAASALLIAPAMLAQEQPAKVHGHVQNPAGQAVNSGQVEFSKDLTKPFKDEKITNTADVDKDGNYTVTGIAPGEYFVWFIQGDKQVDRQQVTFKAGEDRTLDFDMTREEFMKNLTPEERKAIEEFKAKNAAAVAGNKQIANLNATITAVRADIKSATPNFDKDISDMKQATDSRPNEGLLWAVQGEVYTAQGKKLAAADRANKTNPLQDDAVKTAYGNAAQALQKASDLMAAAPKPNPEQQATVLNQLGNVYAEEGKPSDATAAYDKAVALVPKNAGTYYYNEAAVMFNAHQDDAALAAADKAITADPNQPMPYYIKGQELLAKATVDSKGTIVPPPGCVDAYQKYLELAPDGPEAPAVKEVLTSLGQKIQTKYKAGKK